MPEWKTHEKWVERFLEWGKLSDSIENIEILTSFPKEKDFIFQNHDFNRRAWMDIENRSIAYYDFGELGLEIMDLHYCLDFLKEETDPKIIKRKWKIFEAYFPESPEKDIFNIYPSVIDLAGYLALKTKTLKISKDVFKFIIVNFREILTQLTSEHGYKTDELRDWKNSNFNRIIDELKTVS